MRIADKMAYEQVTSNLSKNRTQMSELQNQAATQKRVNKPSDDPLAAARVLANRIDLQGNKQYGKNVGYARSFLEYTDQSLGEISDVLVRAKELAISQSSDGAASEETRKAVATELEQLCHHMVAVGNRKLGDRFIFGGFHTQNSPFDAEGNYAGDTGEMMVHIDKDTFMAMNVPGSRVFLGQGISPDGMVQSNPEQAKSIDELEKQKADAAHPVEMFRGPASLPPGQMENGQPTPGVNLFHVMQNLNVALKTNDKEAIQDTLEVLDQALQQVVLTRAQVGSRASVLDNYTQSIERLKIDNKTVISGLEDADIFSTVSDINKTQATLEATLETAGKLIQPTLLQFLR